MMFLKAESCALQHVRPSWGESLSRLMLRKTRARYEFSNPLVRRLRKVFVITLVWSTAFSRAFAWRLSVRSVLGKSLTCRNDVKTLAVYDHPPSKTESFSRSSASQRLAAHHCSQATDFPR